MQSQRQQPPLPAAGGGAAADGTPVITNLYAARSEFREGAAQPRRLHDPERLVTAGRALSSSSGSAPALAPPASSSSSSSSSPSPASTAAVFSRGAASKPLKQCCGLCRCGGGDGSCCERSRYCCRRVRSARRSCISVTREMTWWQHMLLLVFLVMGATLSVTLFKYHNSVLEWVQEAAVFLQAHKLRGFLVLGAATFATAFPPVPGYSLCCYVAGYAFGMQGFVPVYFAAIVGAFTCFVLFRYFLVDCMFKWVANNKQYGAVNRTVKRLGFRFLILVRFAPFPFAGFNCVLAAIPAVQTWQFLVATMVSELKILFEIYTGIYLEQLTEAHLHKLPLHWWTSAIFVVSLALASFAMYDLYRKTQAELRRSSLLWGGDDEEDDDDDDAADADNGDRRQRHLSDSSGSLRGRGRAAMSPLSRVPDEGEDSDFTDTEA